MLCATSGLAEQLRETAIFGIFPLGVGVGVVTLLRLPHKGLS